MGAPEIRIERLSVWYGNAPALKEISLSVPGGSITALIGPSGCGKSTLLRVINRMVDRVPYCRVRGNVWIGRDSVLEPGLDLAELRRRVGMVFQRPNPFPFSIFENVAFGPRLHGYKSQAALRQVVEQSLRQAALWDEVRGKLRRPAHSLSGGQQQRLCIARALAVGPEVLLMDEPTSALDPLSAARIEELVVQLKERYTIVMVTHNLQQAARFSDFTGFFQKGELVEVGETRTIFTAPKDRRTEEYLTGRLD